MERVNDKLLEFTLGKFCKTWGFESGYNKGMLYLQFGQRGMVRLLMVNTESGGIWECLGLEFCTKREMYMKLIGAIGVKHMLDHLNKIKEKI